MQQQYNHLLLIQSYLFPHLLSSFRRLLSSSLSSIKSVAESNHFTYLDARGAYRQYKLAEAQAVKESFIKGFPYAFLFKFTD